MSLQLNNYQIAGNLARDPEFKMLANDRSVCAFTVITNRSWKDDAGERVEESTPVRCTAWGKTADFIAGHFSKGQAIFAAGRLKFETWEKDGHKHSTLVMVVDEVRFVTSAPVKPAAAGTQPPPAEKGPASSPAPAIAAQGAGDEPPF